MAFAKHVEEIVDILIAFKDDLMWYKRVRVKLLPNDLRLAKRAVDVLADDTLQE